MTIARVAIHNPNSVPSISIPYVKRRLGSTANTRLILRTAFRTFYEEVRLAFEEKLRHFLGLTSESSTVLSERDTAILYQ